MPGALRPATRLRILPLTHSEFATQDRFVYKHSWAADEMVMWDNRATLHRATSYDTGRERRVVERTVVKGDVPA